MRGSVSDISGKEDHRGKAEEVRIFEEEERVLILRRISDATILGKTQRGRQKTKWKDACNRDMESVWLKAEDVEKRNPKLFRRHQMMGNG